MRFLLWSARHTICHYPFQLQGEFADFASARAAAGSRLIKSGYDDGQVIDGYAADAFTAKNAALSPKDEFNLKWINRWLAQSAEQASGSSFTVVDFGGNAALHYLCYRAQLKPHPRLKWVVLETPEVCARAKETWARAGMELGAVEFVSDPAMVPAFDVFFSSAAICAIEDVSWVYALASRASRGVLFTRAAILSDREFVTLLNLGSIRQPRLMPIKIHSEAFLKRALQDRWELKATHVSHDERVMIPFKRTLCSEGYLSYVFEPRKEL